MTLHEFIKDERSRFRARHPAEDGWHVHLCANSYMSFIPKAPAFLRSALKPADFDEAIVTHIFYDQGHVRERLTYLPRMLRGKGAIEYDWQGDISLKWRGARIHLRRLWAPREGPTAHELTFIATTDLAALESFWKEGLRFCKQRRHTFIRKINVINGPDLPRPKQRWTDVVLPDGMKAQIRDNFEAFLKARKAYKELGLPYRRGFLFIGPPGNGKTLVSKVIASEYRVNMVTLLIKSNLDERTMDQAFSTAVHNAPCVLLLEDLDKMVDSRQVSLAYLLNTLDGLSCPEGIIVIATTNNPGRLDPALLHRPSRFDRVWEFKLPGFAERLALLKLKNRAGFSDAAIERAAKASQGFSMAYVQEALTSAMLAALHAKVKAVDAHLDTAVAQLKVQIKEASSGSAAVGSPQSIGFSA